MNPINYPVPISNSSGNVAAATATATLPAATGKTTYLSGFAITGAGATAASVISATVTNVNGGTQTYSLAIPAGAAVGVTPLIVYFDPSLPATGSNTTIVVSAPTFGAGNTNATVNAWGYQL